tara:strand:+ start:246 stop:518 length:273 start_codon:yes stop_codon:yes gene_type:complete
MERREEMELELDWLKIVKKCKPNEQYGSNMKKKLTKKIRKGVPMSVRGSVWRMLCNVDEVESTIFLPTDIERDGEIERQKDIFNSLAPIG